METRANYVLIGAFALAGFLGLIGFFLWFARVELDRQFAYYDVRFESVSGLSRASEVRFAGLPVGTVVDVRLSTQGDDRVVVRLEVAADTPVRTGSVATIEAQGVTGISFVGISAGAPGEPLLSDEVEGVPEIEAGRSVLQTITEDAPEILSEALEVMRTLGELFSAENRDRVEAVLINLEESSGDLGAALQDFAAITGIVGAAATDIAVFTNQLEPLVDGLAQTLGTADSALATVADVGDRLTVTLDEGDAVLAAARRALDNADRIATESVPPLLDELRGAAAALRGELELLGPEARTLMAEFGATGRAATARLQEAETTLAAAEALIGRIDGTLEGVERATAAAEQFISGEGTELAAAATRLADQDVPRALADLRSAAASARMMADDVAMLISLEVPRVIEDLRRTAASVQGQIELLGGDARVMMAEFTAAGSAATARLQEAEATLAGLDGLVARLEGTLEGVDRTTGAVEALVAGDGAALVADARAMLSEAQRAVAAVTQIADADLPVILEDVRAATGTAARVVEAVGSDLTSATGRIEALSGRAELVLDDIGASFARAGATLDAIDAALVTGERTLEAAERAFAEAERVLDGDVAAVAADLRSMIAQLEDTMAVVAADFPAITGDLRAAAAAADVAFAEFEAMAREARGPVRDFATGALPQISQLAREARSLVSSFERLVRQIERDPSRVLFSRPPPEFRR